MNKQLARLGKTAAPLVAIALGSFLVVAILIPAILVDRTPVSERSTGRISTGTTDTANRSILTEQDKTILVPVYRSAAARIEQVPLETYVRGVVAGEMPAEFEVEALKAQALAARTYITKRLIEQDTSQVPVSGAIVTDTTAHQVYYSEEDLKRLWGADSFKVRIEKLNQAVNETQNQILTYKGQVILAAFFSTSNGYTENSEDYWANYIPYLRSVASPWDKKWSPKYEQKVILKGSEVYKSLGLPASVPVTTGNSSIRILETSDGQRIKRLQIAGKSFTGRDVREKLGLASSQFIWKVKGKDIEITTYGYGHGVGMSQWGAQGMAKEGYSAEQIVKHYYQGIEIQPASSILKK